jgi:hypothetical protein
MVVVWKHNGRVVSGPEAIPNQTGGGLVSVRSTYKKPIHLESMGFLAVPEDVAEHRKRFPGVELAMKDGSAVPVMHSLGEKRAYLEATGWEDVRSF